LLGRSAFLVRRGPDHGVEPAGEAPGRRLAAGNRLAECGLRRVANRLAQPRRVDDLRRSLLNGAQQALDARS